MIVRIESLVVLKMISNFLKDEDKEISFDELRNYGAKVISFFKKKSINITIIYSESILNAFCYDYSDIFEICDQKICLKEGITSDHLIDKCLSYLNIDLLNACECMAHGAY